MSFHVRGTVARFFLPMTVHFIDVPQLGPLPTEGHLGSFLVLQL